MHEKNKGSKKAEEEPESILTIFEFAVEVLLQLPLPLSRVKQISGAWSLVGNNGDTFLWRAALFAAVSVQRGAGDGNSMERFLLCAKRRLLHTNLWGLLARDVGGSLFRLVIQSSGPSGSSEALNNQPLPSAAADPVFRHCRGLVGCKRFIYTSL